jgi:hypothetical protein
MRSRIAVFSIAWMLAACGRESFSAHGEEAGESNDNLACIDEDGLVPGVLRLELTPARAWLIDDGAEVELPLGGDDQPEWMLTSVARDYIAIARVDEQSGDFNTIVHVFSRSSGERLWMRDIGGYPWGFGVSDDGWVSGISDVVGTQVGFVMSETETIALPNHGPLAPPALGHVAAYSYEQGYDSQGWVDLEDLSWQPLTPPPDSLIVTITEDHHTFEYLAFIDGAFAFVHARPDAAEIITLPFVIQEEPVYVVASNGRYRVVRRVWNEPPDIDDLRIDIQTGDLELVDPEPPQGWWFFDCMDRDTDIDGDGRLYYELRNDSSAQAWAYDVVDEAWTPVGHPISLIEDLHVRADWQDLVVVSGSEESDCSSAQWTEPPVDALLGNSMQIVRREPALTMVMPFTGLSIDRQQRCVASIEGDGWEVRPLDGSDAVIDLGPGVGDWLWLD